jgi:hypothetical protein
MSPFGAKVGILFLETNSLFCLDPYWATTNPLCFAKPHNLDYDPI